MLQINLSKSLAIIGMEIWMINSGLIEEGCCERKLGTGFCTRRKNLKNRI